MITHQSCKCTSCASYLQFDISSGHLKCLNCGKEYNVEEYIKLFSSYHTCRVHSQEEDPGANNSCYVCIGCGAELSPAVLQSNSFCPICSCVIGYTGRISKSSRPDLIVPFMKEKKDVEIQYRKLVSRRSFLTSGFLRKLEPKSIRPYYFPFWIYDVTIQGKAVADADKRIRLSRYLWFCREYECTSSANVIFTCVPQDRSSSLADKLSQSIEPFDFTKARPYHEAYFAGLEVQMGDRGDKVGYDEMKQRLFVSMDHFLFPDYKKYYHFFCRDRDYQIRQAKIRMAYLPVYLVDVQWHSKTYSFAMNGQTGRLVGDFPLNKLNIFLVSLSFLLLSLAASSQLLEYLSERGMVTDPDYLLLAFLGNEALFVALVGQTRLPLLFDQDIGAYELILISILACYTFLKIPPSWGLHYICMILVGGIMIFYGFLKSNITDRTADAIAQNVESADESIDRENSRLESSTVTYVKSRFILIS